MQKNKRKINEIIIHCTATEWFMPVTVEDVRRWHIERGFKDIGYHYLIDINGIVHKGRALSSIGAHCHGHNKHSIGICYVGGVKDGFPTDTRTCSQKRALNSVIHRLCVTFPITKISGHRDYSSKSCPCFDASKEYSHLIKSIL